jgi:hypothetical protein
MKTFLFYLVTNIIFIPFYSAIMIETRLLTRGNIDDLLVLFFYNVVPNLFVFITIHFLAHRLKLSKKLNFLFFILFAFILFYFTVIDSMDFGSFLS